MSSNQSKYDLRKGPPYASDLALPGPVGFDTPNQTLTVTGNITGITGSIIKSSGNTLNLAPATGSNTYGGGTFSSPIPKRQRANPAKRKRSARNPGRLIAIFFPK